MSCGVVTCACQEAVFPAFQSSHSICRQRRLQSQLPDNSHPDCDRRITHMSFKYAYIPSPTSCADSSHQAGLKK